MKERLPIVLIYIIFLIFILLTFKNYGISWDESNYLQQGQLYSEVFFDPLKIIDTTTNDLAANHNPFFDLIYFLPLKIFSQTGNYELLHLVKAIVASLTLIFVYFSMKMVNKKESAAILAVVLLIFSPRWLGDIFDNELDISAVLLYSIEIFLAIRLLKRKSAKGVWKEIIIFSVLSAMSFSQRVILIFVPILTLILLVWVYLKKHHLSWYKIVGLLVIFTAVFPIPQLLTDPLVSANGLKGIFLKIAVSIRPLAGTTLFDGQIFSLNNLPWYYLPKYIAITTPIITLLFLAFGTILLLSKITKISDISLKASYILILGSFFFPVLSVIVFNPKNYDAWRHFLFLIIPLVIIAGFGFKRILIVLFIVNLMVTGKEMIMLHPYEYVYYNSLVGGLPGAYGKYETDYWAKSTKEAVFWLNNHLPDQSRTYSIYNCTDPIQANYYFTPNMMSVEKAEEANYFICFTRNNLDKQINSQPDFTVEREGVPLNYVKGVNP